MDIGACIMPDFPYINNHIIYSPCNSPQCLHLVASIFIFSAHAGHVFFQLSSIMVIIIRKTNSRNAKM